MSTLIEPIPQPADRPRASRSALADWREMVESGEYNQAVADAVFASKADYENRRRLLLERRQHCEVLTVQVPKAQRAAEAAEEAVAQVEAFLATKIDDEVSVADLRATIALIDPQARTDRPEQLARALLSVGSSGPNSGIGLLRSRASDLRHKANNMRQRAERFLIETSSAGPDTASQSIQQRIEFLRKQIAERMVIIQAVNQVPQQRELVEDLAAGRRSWPGTDPSPSAFRRYFLAAKARLKELVGMALNAEQAKAANQSDGATIERLKEDLQASLEAHRQRCFVPEAMRFEIE